jgi:integrase
VRALAHQVALRDPVTHLSTLKRTRADGSASAITALIDPNFLQEMGWDSVRLLLFPPEGHRLLTRPVCVSEGCSATSAGPGRICGSCQRRLHNPELSDEETVSLPPQAGRRRRGPGQCSVSDCDREWASAPIGICERHLDQQNALGVSRAEFLLHPLTVPFGEAGPCQVASCPRQRRHPDGRYCAAHQIRFRTASRNRAFDEQQWQRTEAPINFGGQVSLRGLPPLVIAQLLYGLQQRCRQEGVKTKEADLRAVCDEVRRQLVDSIAQFTVLERPNLGFCALAHSLVTHARRALATPESEVIGDEWDLAIFGHSGSVSFTAITQDWLREAAKRWAADDLPRRRVRAGRHTSGGLSVRHHVGCVARLSESLRGRPDKGEIPAALDRTAMETFLNRLAYLESTNKISGDARIRACREVRAVLRRVRAMGLTRPGQLAAGLGEDFAIHREDVPDEGESAEPNRDLPAEIMVQLCAQLDDLTSFEMRTAIELAIDTGRRPEELCGLAFDCLARDDDQLPVLVYDNYKANRLGRRLPITESTAQLIVTQQGRVRSKYPHTPVGDLKLLPTDRRNPRGVRAITSFSLAVTHRAWADRTPALLGSDGVEFDRRKLFLYAYRHTYAQRHADAGVGIDVLRELMDHRKLDTTKQYYRVGETRRREAVDRVAALQFDRHGVRTWRSVQKLLDSEHARRAIGEVAVPFGICTEPSNVKAGGNACPFRFRCAGCDHFRTDVSYLPDLQGYLDDLLRNRERLLAATEIDEWAKSEAMPSEEEITRIRHLINQVTSGLDEVSAEERSQVDQAIATIRAQRGVMIGMPGARRSSSQVRMGRNG